MLRRKIAESLTARIFLVTALMLLGAGCVTFGLMAWVTPMTYTAVLNQDLQRQVDGLAQRLKKARLEDCGPLIGELASTAGAEVLLLDPEGNPVETSSRLSGAAEENRAFVTVGQDGEPSGCSTTWEAGETEGGTEFILTATTATVASQVTFTDRAGEYTLLVMPYLQAENQAVTAMKRIAPWLLLSVLAMSLFGAFFYSRYLTRPIVRISKIAGRMAALDFDWHCEEKRRDEIGMLGRSLNQTAGELSGALSELRAANAALLGEVERERELERQRTAFFAAASHELKTPVTILKGQLSGMLDGVGVYRDREKYLARSLQVTARMEELIRELLAVSRMEAETAPIKKTAVDLPALVRRQIRLHGALIEQRGLRLEARLSEGITVKGEEALLEKAVASLLLNAVLYSPEGAELRVSAGLREGLAAFAVENTGAHIREEDLPRLFEAFYRVEPSRNRGTGGSGLGLYLARMISDRHGARCSVRNTEDGVEASIVFEEPPLGKNET